MKRFFILASAAIVALASCAKTEVVYNEQPQEIGFKQITGAMTKGLTDVNDGTMGVFAQYNNTETNQTNVEYFDNTSFSEKETSGQWHANPAKYWPVQGTLDFTVYAPYNATNGVVVYTPATTANTLVINVPDNKPTTTTPSQTDWLYGASRYIGKSKTDNEMTVNLTHALSKISVTIKCAESNAGVFTIQSLSLADTRQSGTLTITYDETSHVGTCTPSAASSAYTHNYAKLGGAEINNTAVTTTAQSFEDILAFPAAGTKYLTLSYNMSGSGAALQAKVAINDEWQTGKNYTYAITLTATEIILTPSATEWVTGSVTGSGTTGDPIVVTPVTGA